MYTKATFARQLKSLIESKGLNQRILADRINTTEATISRYTAGVRTPNIETAVEIAGVLGVSALGCELAGAGWLCLCSTFSTGVGLFTRQLGRFAAAQVEKDTAPQPRA